ncbi:hypothetical protein BGZ51_006166 [Haplosporangium sp. Z 767]|nr:hypothetical protein BGZ50_006178 [Haplosporangium sp. Z 11]KAF9180509.1 hypothetical protein BGZ51_006166 [Haplosporangium sp. Z 767]
MAQQKVSFKKWWKNITGTKAVKGLFHIDLVDSIVYAGVPVHYTVNGQTRCQGYIPTIVSKCGWFLKEKATKTRGIFRVSGSSKRVMELQEIFDTPPNYGSQLDWTGYTIHDASNVLRRYLNHLPDPVITLEYYEKFRDVHRNLTDEEEKIAAYQELISKLPPPHSCLLMYLLDLLALFAHNSDENLMDSKNLASVFQPGVLSHPNHAMSPGEYMTSAAVLKFLVDHQSCFTMPQFSLDEDDEEMTNFGLMSPPTQEPTLQGYVNADEHRQIHDAMTEKGVSFEAEDAVHILGTGMERKLSLHKPIIPHSTLPGQPPQRSKSTNSSTNSNHSGHSNMFSSGFLTRRRSSRTSKAVGKVTPTESELKTSFEGQQDLSDIPENFNPSEEKSESLTPRSSIIRKANTSPPMGLEGPPSEFSSYLSRRKQLKGEGHRREPSVFCQTIEIQFPAPVIDRENQAADNPTTPSASTHFSNAPLPSEPRDDRISQDGNDRPTRTPLQGPAPSTTAHIHIPDPPLRLQENMHVSPLSSPRANAGQRRTSGAAQISWNQETLDYGAAAAQRPTNARMPILRAKSNPGGLGLRNQSHGLSTSHGANQTIEKFKGLFTGKGKDSDSNGSSKDGSNKESKKDKRRGSLTEKQRKYKSQEVVPTQLSLNSASSGWQGAPTHETIQEHDSGPHERAYTQPPPPLPSQKQLGSPPQRPPPPPPEGSLMDLIDPPQRFGHHSGHSTPIGGSRSGSPSQVHPSTRQLLPTNPSFTSSSSVNSMPSSERLYQGRGLGSQGSISSLEFTIPGHRSEENLIPHQRSPRHGQKHSPLMETHPELGQLHIDVAQHPKQSQQQQHLSPYGPSGNSRSHSHVALIDSHPQASLSPPQMSSRSRQGSFGSTDSYDLNAPPILAPKSRERRIPRDGSSSSLRDDVTPPRARSNSSKNTSPAHSPSLKPLSRNPSSQSAQGGGNGAGGTSSHSPPHPQQQHLNYHHNHNHNHHHAPSPLAGSIVSSNYVISPPSSRVRSRAQSRDEQSILHRQESSGQVNRTYERARSRSAAAGLAITSPSPPASSSPSVPVLSTFAGNSIDGHGPLQSGSISRP